MTVATHETKKSEMKPLTIAAGAILLASALPAPLHSGEIEFEKHDAIDYENVLAALSFDSPEKAFEEIATLKSPWNHILTVDTKHGLVSPDPEVAKTHTSLLHNSADIAILKALATAPDDPRYGRRTSDVTVILLLERNEQKWHIADHIIRRNSSYFSVDSVLFEHPHWGPVIHFLEHSGGRLQSENTHFLFLVSPGEEKPHLGPGRRWTQALRITTNNHRYFGSQSLKLAATSGSSIAATLVTSSGNNDCPPNFTKSFDLLWDSANKSFDTYPLVPYLLEHADHTTPDRHHSWVVTPGKSAGLVTASSTVAELCALFGPRKVAGGHNSWEQHRGYLVVYEGEENQLDLDRGNSGNLARATFLGRRSSWVTDTGISLGSTVEEVQKANGAPFVIAAPQGAQAHATSWGDGKFDKSLRIGFSAPEFFASDDTENAGPDAPPIGETNTGPAWQGSSDSPQITSRNLRVSSVSIDLNP